jgi:poly(hydroxyalkanoate) depolymerase family esterase
MLHGCTQNPDDFAAGTRMNTLAEEQLCFVLYPAQTPAANGSKCWNWFKTTDQQRDRGEPSMIAGMTRRIFETYRIDPRRVYVAGLSAGGAMAIILGMTYRDLYAAIGIHSGLPYAMARDLPSALTLMQPGGQPLNGRPATGRSAAIPMRAIVFHGDRDTTVHPGNGDQVIAQCAPPPSGVRAPAGADPLVTVQ